ncbi:hypothetical protein [Micromonospora mirobrigensis]|uniref:Uncharacterized protein n=1 Tax=Micromonospora mirobrigensis TaxID=262898 RepID=A0A1C4TWN9_9ACTN|nr:hypothetical protein [Micromonospora mirobrigensis]SCE63852.1 hypothetical protein GA0070564_1019 [Micromonospora mirobrigensis]
MTSDPYTSPAAPASEPSSASAPPPAPDQPAAAAGEPAGPDTGDPAAPSAADGQRPSPRQLTELFARADAPVKVPDWMREPEVAYELTRGERFRLRFHRHGGKALIGLIGAVALALIGFVGVAGYGFVGKVQRGEQVLPARRGVSVEPRPTDADGNTLGVFLGTEAQDFPAGPAAIVLPPARPTGPFTRAQVADALTQVRAALIAGRLDPRMLQGEPAGLLARLAPDTRDAARAELERGGTPGFATRIAGPWLKKTGIRVRGTIEYVSTTDSEGVRVLAVTTRFTWVYPLLLFQAQLYPAGAELVTVRDEVVWHFPHPDDVRPTSRGLWIDSYRAGVQNATCRGVKQGVLEQDYLNTSDYRARDRRLGCVTR